MAKRIDTTLRVKEQKRSSDLIDGVTSGIAVIPDGMASAVLAEANPVLGLNALIVGKPIGALLTSSQFMAVSITGAVALTTGDVLGEEDIFTATDVLSESTEGALKAARLWLKKDQS